MPAPKRQPIAQPRKVTPAGLTAADKFVTSKPEASAEPVKRMTIIISEPLHRRIKVSCALRGINMVDAIREVLERASWPTSEAA